MLSDSVVPTQLRHVGEQLHALKRRGLNAFGLKELVDAAPRAELEQAVLRVGIAAVVLIYLLIYTLRDGHISDHEWEVDLVAIAFFLFGVALAQRILTTGRDSVARRFIGMVADNAVTTYCLIRMGEGGAVVLGVYLFVTFGNGFRFGRTYLHVCQILGLVGFSLVLAISDFWSQHLEIGIGLIVAMVVLPFYVGVLAERINEARRRADDANKAKGRFLANVSHEMRTPLNGVIAMADVLRESSLNESQREIVDTLGTSAHLLLIQIEDVLDMAKIEAGRVQLSKAPFDLGQLLTSTVKVILPQARHKQLELSVDLPAELNRWFEGDAHHLRQVLLNLLANAVKFTDRGKVQLRVRPVECPTEQSVLRFEVQDTGIGIPLEKQAAIFEPFTQADDSITRLYGGTGLGTTIARQLVTLMGGRIGVESAPDVGSLFWAEIPFSHAHARDSEAIGSTWDSAKFTAIARSIGEHRAPNVTKIKGARILVAEDNTTNQRVAQLVLESGGYCVTIVPNGEAALDELEKGCYDLALMDLSMPLVSGLEALKLYRFTTPSPIPIIILSANVTSEVVAECKASGAAEFVAKPLRPNALLSVIERHLATGTQQSVPTPRRDETPALT
ncbi:MAG: ATP-binding protein, partial [Pseudomonadota bacterium]|nr:ATP-binding protein [Pseudomonadota bacterium]